MSNWWNKETMDEAYKWQKQKSEELWKKLMYDETKDTLSKLSKGETVTVEKDSPTFKWFNANPYVDKGTPDKVYDGTSIGFNAVSNTGTTYNGSTTPLADNHNPGVGYYRDTGNGAFVRDIGVQQKSQYYTPQDHYTVYTEGKGLPLKEVPSRKRSIPIADFQGLMEKVIELLQGAGVDNVSDLEDIYINKQSIISFVYKDREFNLTLEELE